ncbi:retrovirus-related Pol polyprotein from transposon 297 [Trichonephila clavipes]|nr:retrovirus-related Pol polyprotein from transposon 297 [Trichonephila clavipes]
MSVGYLMLVIIEEIGEILKWYIDRIMVEMIIGVNIRTTVKEISRSRAGIGLKTINDRGYQFRNRGQNDDFSRGDQRNRDSSENFSGGSRKQMGRLNVLKVSDIKGDQTESLNQSPIKLSAICMSPVELPYVPILLDETFTKALWDTGVEKSFISEETYQKYFFYKQVKKSSTQVITVQKDKCRNMGVVELNIRIRDFEKPWLFHVLADLEYPCIGIYFISGSKIILDFDRKFLAIPDSQINKVVEIEKVEIDLSKTKLEEKQKRELQDLFNSFQGLFSDKPGLTHFLYHEIDTGDNPPVVSRPYRYDKVKQEILDYHVDKMLKEGNITPIQSPYASPVVLCRKNNGLPPDNPEAYRFAVDYRKLNVITKYPRYPLSLIDDLIMNIPHTGIMSALDLRSGYFQMAVNPSDIVKTAFVTKNGTYAFRRMPFGLSGAVPNFQKAIDIILKPVIGKFVNVYMDDVIISSSSFTQHVKHLKEVFRLLHEAVLTLDKDKCKFGCEELKYLGLIINKEGIKTDETKVQAIVEMKPPRNSREVSKFLGMSQCSIGIGAVVNQEQRPVVFASRTLSAAERNYTVTERECLAVVWARNKFRTYLGSFPIKVITDHAALTHLTTGKNLSNRMIRWALKLAEFNIEWEHRPGTQNTIADVLSRNPIENIIGEKVNCAIIRDLVLSSHQLIEEQKTDSELGHIYRYLENPEDSSVNAAICENWSRDFRLVEGLLFYAKYATSLGEM